MFHTKSLRHALSATVIALIFANSASGALAEQNRLFSAPTDDDPAQRVRECTLITGAAWLLLNEAKKDGVKLDWNNERYSPDKWLPVFKTFGSIALSEKMFGSEKELAQEIFPEYEKVGYVKGGNTGVITSFLKMDKLIRCYAIATAVMEKQKGGQ
ncbi:hypothetical protein [Zavarzinia aquatilis]|nr:hypothetical protein [Zavarzinia aquatilis]